MPSDNETIVDRVQAHQRQWLHTGIVRRRDSTKLRFVHKDVSWYYKRFQVRRALSCSLLMLDIVPLQA